MKVLWEAVWGLRLGSSLRVTIRYGLGWDISTNVCVCAGVCVCGRAEQMVLCGSPFAIIVYISLTHNYPDWSCILLNWLWHVTHDNQCVVSEWSVFTMLTFSFHLFMRPHQLLCCWNILYKYNNGMVMVTIYMHACYVREYPTYLK